MKASFRRGRRARARPARKVWYGVETKQGRLRTLFKRAGLHAEARRHSNHAHMQQQLATLEISLGREDGKRGMASADKLKALILASWMWRLYSLPLIAISED